MGLPLELNSPGGIARQLLRGDMGNCSGYRVFNHQDKVKVAQSQKQNFLGVSLCLCGKKMN
jgi:hypothetical protein